MPEALPPVPVFNLAQIFSSRERIVDKIFYLFMGAEVTGEVIHALAEHLRALFKLPPSCHPAALDSLRCLAGRILDKRLSAELSWRLAGNIAALRKGLAVVPWSRQASPEWVPVQILSSRYFIRKRSGKGQGEAGRNFHYRFLAGSPCPGIMTKFWSKKALDFAARHLGFTTVRQGLSKRHDLEMTSMRMLVLLEPHLCRRGPGFRHFYCPGSFVEYNQAIMKQRRRQDFVCPFGYGHECFQCPEGLAECGAATHPSSFEVKMCSGCGEQAWFDTDPRYVNEYCVQCQPMADSGLTPKPKEKTCPATTNKSS
jgi:hypothetical protein